MASVGYVIAFNSAGETQVGISNGSPKFFQVNVSGGAGAYTHIIDLLPDQAEEASQLIFKIIMPATADRSVTFRDAETENVLATITSTGEAHNTVAEFFYWPTNSGWNHLRTT
jgi:hypothetical protein